MWHQCWNLRVTGHRSLGQKRPGRVGSGQRFRPAFISGGRRLLRHDAFAAKSLRDLVTFDLLTLETAFIKYTLSTCPPDLQRLQSLKRPSNVRLTDQIRNNRIFLFLDKFCAKTLWSKSLSVLNCIGKLTYIADGDLCSFAMETLFIYVT